MKLHNTLNMTNNMNKKYCFIIGLDTPLYCVASGIPGVGVSGPELEDSDAKFVDTIRTTFLSGLFFQEQGHADFHVGCDGCKCSKFMSLKL